MPKSLIKILIITFAISIANFSVANAGWTTGKYNSAIDFNGENTYIDGFGDIGNIKTVSFWMKADDTTDRKIMDFDGGTHYLEIDVSKVIQAHGFTSPTIYIDGKVSSTLADMNWHYIAVTTDTDVSASAMVIGKVGADYFDGALDDVELYAYARAADEIRLDYQAGVATHLGPSGKTCSEDPASCMDYGLVGHWGMNEGAGTTAYDSSDNSNDGTLGGGTASKMPKWTAGHSVSGEHRVSGGAGALQFDGKDDYVDCGNDESLDITDAITIEAWVKTIVVPEDNNQIILDKRVNGAGAGYYLYLRSADNQIHFSVGNEVAWDMPVGLKDNWHHLVGTFNGTQIKLYYDGDLKNTAAYSGNVATNNGDLFIGSKSNNDLNFNGTIDEVRIYNRALSAEEVRYHYNKGGPVAEWKFDEGSGQTAHDSVGTANGQLGANSDSVGDANDPAWSTP